MQNINDPQMAQLIERVSNMSEDIREVRTSQAKVEQVVLTTAGIQRDIAHIDEKVRHLYVVSDSRGPEMVQVDKRVASLERWHKLIGVALMAAAGSIGWGVQRIEYLYKLDTRVQILELLANGEKIERAFKATPQQENKE